MIRPLTSLRFVFALMVFVHHLGFLGNSSNTNIKEFYHAYLWEGFIGVSFFFILSGYILSYVYADKLPERKISKKRFFIYRIARIYPLHLLTLILALPLTHRMFSETPGQWSLKLLENLTLTQSFIPIKDHYFSFNIVSWSISNELFFYLLFPFLLVFFIKLKPKYALGAFALLGAGLLIAMNTVPEKWHHAIFYVNPIARSLDFILGILLFKFQKHFRIENKLTATFLEIGSIAFLAAMYLLANSFSLVFRFSIYYWLPISVLLIIYSSQKGLISRFLSSKPFVSLGEVSYGFYLFHFMIIQYSLSAEKRLQFFENDIIQALCIFAISIVLSYLSYWLFEKPANKFVKKMLLRHRGEKKPTT